MFWDKSVELESGVVVAYWKLVRVNIDLGSNKAECSYAGYVSEEAHEAGKPHVLQSGCIVDFAGMDAGDKIMGAILDKVKLAQGFEK